MSDLEEDGVLRVVIVTLGVRQSSWNPLAMDEVAHDPVGNRPVVAVVDAVMVRAQLNVIRRIEST